MTSTLSSNITTGLDSMNKLSNLIETAQEFGLSGIAITNHDNLCEVIEINREQKRLRKENSDFVLAIGNEIYLIDKYIDNDSVKQLYYHFILIAKDKIGYNALVQLSSKAWYRSSILRGKRRVPTEKADVEEIMSWAKGHLVATSACLGGELAKRILANELDEAERFYEWCIEQFGEEDFFIELQPSRIPDQINFNKKVTTLFSNAKFTIATDTHYLLEKDFPIFEAFLRSDEKNKKREVKEFYDYARLMKEDEIFSLMGEMDFKDDFVRECLDNTLKVQQQVEFYDLAQKQIIPKIPLNDIDLILEPYQLEEIKAYPTLSWGLAADDVGTRYCTQYCLNSMVEKGLWDKSHLERLEEEFEVHKFQSEQLESNFFNYVNVMQWVINLAWSIDCAVGPSRGSASGCLLNYLMDVVQNDPLKYDLPFFRYLHKERVTPLDIDTDFQPSKRAALFAAIREQRGELGLTQVATYRTLTLKAAIATAGRGYRSKEFPQGLDSDITTYLSSLIEVRRGFVATLKQTLYGDETTGYTKNTTFINECNQYKGLLDIIIAVEGLVVGSGTHAAAVILFDDQDRIFNHCSLMRAPNGDLCTSLDLRSVEESGCYKYDFLLLSTLDIQATCFQLLQKHNKINPNMTLKECFRTYINPNTIDYSDKRIWQHLYDNDVLSIFQFDAASGRRGVLAAKPESLAEMTCINGIIRLVTPEDGEDQLDRFCVNKEFPERFEKEMVEANLPLEVRRIMHEVLDPYQGCAATQETFMVLTRQLLGYSLRDADVLRKVVAKKKMSEIQTQRDFFNKKGEDKGYNESQLNYLWNVVIAPSLGYGFSLNHALPYSMIGIQCILMGGILFHPIYWQTACLLQRSGALDGKTTDYNKIAKAVSALSEQGVNIQPPSVNKSKIGFELDEETNTIYFGLSGIKGLKEKVIDSIINLRPFKSIYDFMVRTNADVTSLTTLVKAGAFDEFSSRSQVIYDISRFKSDQKMNLNGQNFSMLAKNGFWPMHTPELEKAFYFFNFNQYLKLTNKNHSDSERYSLNERAKNFLIEKGIDFEEDDTISKVTWKKYYDSYMVPMKRYLVEHQQEMLQKVNAKMIADWRDKYFPPDSNLSQWEIETLGLCFGEHPMSHLINVSYFNDLPIEPEVSRTFLGKGGRTVPLYKLTMIAGIVIAKDKLHSSITLLTSDGPVEVKFRKQQFANYDAQISRMVDGHKKVIEKSWLNRGVGLIIHGMRQDDQFIAKTYKNSPMKHTAYKVTEILSNGKVKVQTQRKSGEQEESEDE